MSIELSKCSALPKLIVAVLALAVTATPWALAQRIEVNSADPSSGEQGMLDLQVTIKGAGFPKGAKAKFLVTGTEDTGGVEVTETRFIDSSTLIGTINISEAADLSKFDILVYSGRRTGKGKELFTVLEKTSTDPNGTVHLVVEHQSHYESDSGVFEPYQIQPDDQGTYYDGIRGISAILDKGSQYNLTMSRDLAATDCDDPEGICYTRYFWITLPGDVPGWVDGPAKLFLAVAGIANAPMCDTEPPLQLSARGQVVGLEWKEGASSLHRSTLVYNLYWTNNVYACELPSGESRRWAIWTDPSADALLQIPKTRGNGWRDYGDVPMAFELTATEVIQ